MIKSKKLSTKLFRLCSDESIISHRMILNRYSLFCVYSKTLFTEKVSLSHRLSKICNYCINNSYPIDSSITFIKFSHQIYRIKLFVSANHLLLYLFFFNFSNIRCTQLINVSSLEIAKKVK